jgi:pimeloyl-ACP methyl ester carboxylesterase
MNNNFFKKMLERENFAPEIDGLAEAIKYKLIKFKKGSKGEDSLKVLEAQPEKIVSEIPVIIAPGWGNTAIAMRKSLETFGRKGRRAITFDHRREQSLSSISKDQNEQTETLQRAFEILAVLKQQEIEGPVNGMGYSEGGIDILLAAKIEPERFKRIVLVAPGGMMGEDNKWKLAGRFIKGAIKDGLSTVVKPETLIPVMRYTKELAKYLGKNPAMAYREVSAIAQSDITVLVKELTDMGISVDFICGSDDKAFPMYSENDDGTLAEKTVQKQAGRIYKEQRGMGKEANIGFYSVKGGHGELMLYPDKYTAVAEEAYRARENKSK